jgi:hypothetical protein
MISEKELQPSCHLPTGGLYHFFAKDGKLLKYKKLFFSRGLVGFLDTFLSQD